MPGSTVRNEAARVKEIRLMWPRSLTLSRDAGMYIVGTILPPLLPTVFVVSVGISAKRLQAKRISCTNPEGIIVAGKVSHSSDTGRSRTKIVKS